MIKETPFKLSVKTELQEQFPGCVLLNMDPLTTFQGIPDLLVLFRGRWAMLEFKRHSSAARQANQEFYVKMFNDMSYSSFISPENKEEVFNALHKAFRA